MHVSRDTCTKSLLARRSEPINREVVDVGFPGLREAPPPDAVRDQILAEKAPGRLERWHERAILAASAAEVLEEPS